MTQDVTVPSVAQELFPDLDLGDIRRNRRFQTVVGDILDRPGQSLPQIFPDPTQYRACLNLFDAPEATHQRIFAAHRDAVLKHLATVTRPVLLIHDTTVLDYSGHTTLEDENGPVGNGGGRGWLAHHTLAVDPADRTVFGLVGQILHVRRAVGRSESTAAKRDRLSRESRLWLQGIEGVGPNPEGTCRIDVADRGADIFEFLAHLQSQGRRFVVRSSHNRALGSDPSDEKAESLLHDSMRSLPASTAWELKLPGRAGQKPRTVVLSVSYRRVELRPPHVKKGHYASRSLPMTAIRVWEADPPEGTVALEWLLLTGEACETVGEVHQVANWYSCRPQIEEYHKVQKSGVGIEGFQVQSAKKLQAMIAVVSAIAVAMMNLRLAARDEKLREKPAEEFVPKEWVKVLQMALKAVLGKCPTGPMTVRDFWVGLSRLGGYQKNPQKHPPGWITLWRGWAAFRQMLVYHKAIAGAE